MFFLSNSRDKNAKCQWNKWNRYFVLPSIALLIESKTHMQIHKRSTISLRTKKAVLINKLRQSNAQQNKVPHYKINWAQRKWKRGIETATNWEQTPRRRRVAHMCVNSACNGRQLEHQVERFSYDQWRIRNCHRWIRCSCGCIGCITVTNTENSQQRRSQRLGKEPNRNDLRIGREFNCSTRIR